MCFCAALCVCACFSLEARLRACAYTSCQARAHRALLHRQSFLSTRRANPRWCAAACRLHKCVPPFSSHPSCSAVIASPAFLSSYTRAHLLCAPRLPPHPPNKQATPHPHNQGRTCFARRRVQITHPHVAECTAVPRGLASPPAPARFFLPNAASAGVVAAGSW